MSTSTGAAIVGVGGLVGTLTLSGVPGNFFFLVVSLKSGPRFWRSSCIMGNGGGWFWQAVNNNSFSLSMNVLVYKMSNSKNGPDMLLK